MMCATKDACGPALKAASLIWKQRSCKYTVYIYIYTYVHTYLYTRVISKNNPNPRWCIQLLHFHVPLCHPHFVVRLFASTARSRESAADTASDSCPLRIAASQNQRVSKLLQEDESSHPVKFHQIPRIYQAAGWWIIAILVGFPIPKHPKAAFIQTKGRLSSLVCEVDANL